MKQIFLAFFTLLLCSLSAQDSNVIAKDSSWIINKSGVFYQARYQLQTNGTETVIYSPIGDTTQTARVFTENIRSEANRMANDANLVRSYGAIITDLIRFAKEVPQVVGKSPLDSIAKTEPELYTSDFWQLNETGIKFRRTQNAFQWQADTSQVWRPFTYLGGIIRINGLNGKNTDFFAVPNKKRFQTVDAGYTIKPVSPGNKTRLVIEGKDKEPKPTTVLRADGVVIVDGVGYKYNSRSKKWVKQ